jgi:hypothetical protein
MLGTSLRRIVRVGTVIAVLTTSVAVAAGPDDVRDYDVSGTAVTGVRPTAVGLPRLGTVGTIGAGELTNAVRDYHDSGRYEKDLATVDTAAKSYLAGRLAQIGTPTGPVPLQRTCSSRYRRVKRAPGRRALYSRRKVCKTGTQAPSTTATGKPAIVLDIDETSLSNYSGLESSGFTAAGVAANSVSGTGTVIAPTLDLYRYARNAGVAVFFITGRPASLNATTEANLKSAGYDKGWDGVANKPPDKGTLEFKSGERAAVEGKGYDIIANVGDQESDLAGGHAERAFKLPNPFYFISE